MNTPRNGWEPGWPSNLAEWRREWPHGLTLYVTEAPEGKGWGADHVLHPSGSYRYRYQVWHTGTLLGRGYDDYVGTAMERAEQRANVAVGNIQDAVRRMDIRNTANGGAR